jgi:hypothetical protein
MVPKPRRSASRISDDSGSRGADISFRVAAEN